MVMIISTLLEEPWFWALLEFGNKSCCTPHTCKWRCGRHSNWKSCFLKDSSLGTSFKSGDHLVKFYSYMQCSGTIVNSVSFCLYVQNTYIHRYYAYVMYGVRARATEYLSNKHKRRSTYLTPWFMAFARLRWMTLCPSLPQSFSILHRLSWKCQRKTPNRLPPFLLRIQVSGDQLLSLHPPQTAAKGPFRCLRSTAHSLLTFLEDWRDKAEATSTWWNNVP